MRTCCADRELCSALRGDLNAEEIYKRGDICIRGAESLCWTAETNIVKQLNSSKSFKKTEKRWHPSQDRSPRQPESLMQCRRVYKGTPSFHPHLWWPRCLIKSQDHLQAPPSPKESKGQKSTAASQIKAPSLLI